MSKKARRSNRAQLSEAKKQKRFDNSIIVYFANPLEKLELQSFADALGVSAGDFLRSSAMKNALALFDEAQEMQAKNLEQQDKQEST